MTKRPTNLNGTISILNDRVANLIAEKDSLAQSLSEQTNGKKEAMQQAGRLSAEVDDLKRRVAHQVETIAHLRGYVARVREDDTVNEPLVMIGEPGGEQLQIPKRLRSELPHDLDPNMPDPRQGASFDSYAGMAQARAPRRRHWVGYGRD